MVLGMLGENLIVGVSIVLGNRWVMTSSVSTLMVVDLEVNIEVSG